MDQNDPNQSDDRDETGGVSETGAGAVVAALSDDIGDFGRDPGRFAQSTYLSIKQGIYSGLYTAASGVEDFTEGAVDVMAKGADDIDGGIDWAAGHLGMKMPHWRLGDSIRNAGSFILKGEDSLRADLGHLDIGAMYDTLHYNTHFYLKTGERKDPTLPGERCAEGVRLGCGAAGIDFKKPPGEARDYVSYLRDNKQYGFTEIRAGYGLDTGNYVPQAMDIVVWDKNHIAMYDGRQWVSDFVQRDMAGGDKFRDGDHFTIFRQTGAGHAPASAAAASHASHRDHGKPADAHKPPHGSPNTKVAGAGKKAPIPGQNGPSFFGGGVDS